MPVTTSRRRDLLWMAGLALCLLSCAAWVRMYILEAAFCAEAAMRPIAWESYYDSDEDDQDEEKEIPDKLRREKQRLQGQHNELKDSDPLAVSLSSLSQTASAESSSSSSSPKATRTSKTKENRETSKTPKSKKASKTSKTRSYSGMMTCNFSPTTPGDCLYNLSQFICGAQPLQLKKKSQTQSSSSAESQHGHSSKHSLYIAKDGVQQLDELYLSQRRLLLLGDSTMGPNCLHKFAMQHLLPERLNMNPICNNRYSCQYIFGQRCSFQHQFGAPLVAEEEWVYPDSTKEGPTAFGLANPLCADCNGCYTQMLHCSPKSEEISTTRLLQEKTEITGETERATCAVGQGNQTYLSGGYITMEFARDVEWQTKKYKTSQENLAAFLQSSFNHPTLVREFGRPICVVNTGHHDIDIRDITLEQHIKNVQWYIELLLPQCQFIVWIETTAPLTDLWVQTKNATRAWNTAVYDMLSSLDADLSSMERKRATEKEKGPSSSNNNHLRNGNRIFYMKTFDSSMDFPHDDNIHLESSWYRSMSEAIMAALYSCPHGGFSSRLLA